MPLEHVNLARGKDSAAAPSNEKFTATPDEIRAIEEKMKDPVFVQLMHEYMQSLEDPETRREEEAYLEQAEREAREGGDFSFEFVFPRPAYVVELLEPSHTCISATEAQQHGVAASTGTLAAHASGSFLNVCHSEKVGAFREHTTGNAQGSNWEVPVSVSQRRVELYNPIPASASTAIPAEYAAVSSSPSNASTLSQLCVVHDVVFHPSTLALAERSTKFMCFLTEIAVEHINSGYGESNGFKFRRLPGSVLSIGTPQNQTLRTQKGNSPFEANPRDAVLQGPTKHLPTPVAPSPAVPRTSQANTQSPTHAATQAPTEKTLHQLPPHTITHRGAIDLTDAWRWTVLDKRIGIPEELVVKLTFPEVRRAAALDIVITPDGHALRIDKTEGQTQFDGLLVLPFTVEEVPTQAQFDRMRGVLTLTLKVVPPPLPDGVASAEEVRKTLPGAVRNDEKGEVKKADAPESFTAAVVPPLPDTTEAPTERDTEPTTIHASSSAESKEDKEQGEEKKQKSEADTSVAPSLEQEVPAAVPGKAEVAHIGDQDRVATMMAQVAAARAARASAEKAAEAPEEVSQGKKEATKEEAEVAPQDAVDKASKKNEEKDVKANRSAEVAAAVDEMASADTASVPHSIPPPTAVAAPTPDSKAEEITFLCKGGVAAEAADASFPAESLRHVNAGSADGGGDDVEAVRVRQQAWASMMEAEMQVAKAREEADAAEAARAAEVAAARARRKLAAEKEQERLEQLAQAKRNTVPLSNKYIFSID